MRARIRAIAGLIGTSVLLVGVAAPAGAGTAHGETDGWAMDVSIPNYTWTKTSGCEEVPVGITMNGWGADSFTVDMDVRHSASGSDSGWLYEFDYTDAGHTVDEYRYESSFLLCPFDSPAGTYIVEGTGEYGWEVDYTDHGQPGTPSTDLATTFTLSRMSSSTRVNAISAAKDGTATVSGRVTGRSPKYGWVGVGSEEVSIQRYVNGAWRQAGTAWTNPTGTFSTKLWDVKAAVPYRVVFPGSDKVSRSISANVTAKLPAAPKPTVKVKATSKKSKLRVDVDPNKGKGYWSFTVQKKSGSSWVTVKSSTTKGSKETRTINLPKGTYRVKVNPKYGYGTAYSSAVTLVK